MSNDGPIGEIVEASLTTFTAEVPPHRLYDAPAFGSAVRFEDAERGDTVYAVVAAAETGSVETHRRAAAFWQSEADLRKNQPQIFELLSTRIRALIVGHLWAGEFTLRLPPRPPRVHGFVYDCGPDEVLRLTDNPAILRRLLDAPDGCADDLIAAVLRSGAILRSEPQAFLVTAGKQLSFLLRDDYPRLQSIIRKLE